MLLAHVVLILFCLSFVCHLGVFVMEVVNVMAMSLDGRIGLSDNEGDDERIRVGLSSKEDRRFLLHQISQSDAIIVGATSIRANGRCLAAKGVSGYPEWFILAQNPLPFSMPFWGQEDIPRTLVTKDQPERGFGVRSLCYGAKDPSLYLYQTLKERGFKKVLLFGGGIVNRYFYDNNLVDELKIAISPLILGNKDASFFVQPPLSRPAKLLLQGARSEENFVFLDYKVAR